LSAAGTEPRAFSTGFHSSPSSQTTSPDDLEQLEHLLSLSGYFSAAWLEADPVWAPLRSMPRFAVLMGRAQ